MAGPTLRFSITGDADPGIREMRRFSGEVDKQSKGIKDSFSKIGTLAAGLGVATFLKGAITQASDLNETMNKSATIFGEHAAEMQEWAQGSETALGLSHQAALDAAASFGDMFSQIGFGIDQAADLSQQIVQMAADFGSFNNLGTDDVLERISASLRGEFDSLQAIIPNINAARVEQEALNETNKKAASELTAQEKAQATLNILMKDGARAQGDFARTSDGFANQQKILTAQFQDLQAEIGQVLLPILVQLAGYLGDVLTFVQNNADEIKFMAIAVGTAYVAFKTWKILTSISVWLATARARYLQYVAALSYGTRVQRAQSAVLRSGAVAALGATAGIVAIGFAIAQMVDKASLMEKLDQMVEGLKQSTAGWRDELLESNLALTDNIKLSIAKALQDAHVADELDKFGVSLDEVTAAITGGQAARDEFIASLYDQGQLTATSAVAIIKLGKEYDENRRAAQQLAGTTAGAAVAQKELSNSTEDTNKKIKDQTTALEDLTEAFERFNRRVIDPTEANIAFEDSLDNLTKSFKGHNDSLDISTKKGREHTEAILELVKAAQEDAKATLERTKSTDKAKQAFREDRAEIRQHLMAVLDDRDAVQKLIEKFAQMPEFKQTKYELRTEQAEAAILHLSGMIDALGVHAGSAINIRTGGAVGPGFAAGTPSAPPGWAWVGERGPELLRFRGGETVLPSPTSMAVARGYAGGAGGLNVRVYLGDRELTDMVRVEVDDALGFEAVHSRMR